MKKAYSISDIPNAFVLRELRVNELDEYYYDQTMITRTGRRNVSPIEDIFEDCLTNETTHAYLLMGHKGCGKSTELNRLAQRLANEGYQVRTIECSKDINMDSPLFSEILILLAEQLLDIAETIKCNLEKDTILTLLSFWKEEAIEYGTFTKERIIEIEGGAGLGSPEILKPFLELFFKLKADSKLSENNRVEYKKKLEKRPSEWLNLLRDVADQISRKMDYRKPVIIFEDLDKLDEYNPENPWEIFLTNGAFLKDFNFPIIYTFPIAMSYDPRFGALDGFYEVKNLPMIKLHNSTDTPDQLYEPGYDAIMAIIEKRCDLSLFEDAALKEAIIKTGGSLRDLFKVINEASRLARRSGSDSISLEMIQDALEDIKSSLTRRFDQESYEFLMKIYKGEKDLIIDKPMLLQMMRANIVLEYNSKRWHDLHPLVRDFFKDHEQKITDIIRSSKDDEQ
ncbi:MAG: ATP-binding protein [Solobacterium sp.]|nr:ATP-binding protein [Solobacterium sp.]